MAKFQFSKRVSMIGVGLCEPGSVRDIDDAVAAPIPKAGLG